MATDRERKMVRNKRIKHRTKLERSDRRISGEWEEKDEKEACKSKHSMETDSQTGVQTIAHEA